MGTRLRSEIRGGQDERVGKLKNQFEILKTNIADWNRSALNGVHTLDEIIKKHIALCTTISELSKKALLYGVDLVTCGAIANLRHLANNIKRDAKRILSNQGTNETNLILPHSIGNNYLVDMGTSFSENNVTNSTSEYPHNSNDEIIRSSYAEMNRFPQHGSGREDTEETRVDLSSTLSCALSQIPDLASNPKLGFETISMYIDGWRNNISTTMNSQVERSAKHHALTTSTNEEMITMKSLLINMQAMIQVNAYQGNKNVDHISILNNNNKVLFVKKNVDKITLEISEKVNQFET